MLIVNQTKDEVINFDNVFSIMLSGKEICANMKIGYVTLGIYESKERANEIFQQLFVNGSVYVVDISSLDEKRTIKYLKEKCTLTELKAENDFILNRYTMYMPEE